MLNDRAGPPTGRRGELGDGVQRSCSEGLPKERSEFETHHLLENQVQWFCPMFTSLLIPFAEGLVPLVTDKSRDVRGARWAEAVLALSQFLLCVPSSVLPIGRLGRCIHVKQSTARSYLLKSEPFLRMVSVGALWYDMRHHPKRSAAQSKQSLVWWCQEHKSMA